MEDVVTEHLAQLWDYHRSCEWRYALARGIEAGFDSTPGKEMLRFLENDKAACLGFDIGQRVAQAVFAEVPKEAKVQEEKALESALH